MGKLSGSTVVTTSFSGSDLASPSTSMSTVCVQAGKARLVLSVQRNHTTIQVRIRQMEPDLIEVGNTLEEAKTLRQEHDDLLLKLNAKQKEVTVYLQRADTAAEKKEEVARMVTEAFKDVYKQLEYRKMLLDQSISFHNSAQQFSKKMTLAEDKCASITPAHDVETAKRLLAQHQEMKRSILEASMITLQEGQHLLERIREMAARADVQSRHATTSACYGIEQLLIGLQDKKMKLDELWWKRKAQLEQGLQLALLEEETNKVSTWYETVLDVYLAKKELGDSLDAAYNLQEEHTKIETQEVSMPSTVHRLAATADQLSHGGLAEAKDVATKVHALEQKCDDARVRLNTRHRNIAAAINFLSLTQVATVKLDMVEVQLGSSDLQQNIPALVERHANLAADIVDATTAALHEGAALVRRVGKDEPGAKAIATKLTDLQDRCVKLYGLCSARPDPAQQSEAVHQLYDKCNRLGTWLNQISAVKIASHRSVGTNLTAARDLLELYEQLDHDQSEKQQELKAMTATVEELTKAGDKDAEAAGVRVTALHNQADQLSAIIQRRVRIIVAYVAYHRKAHQLAVLMDKLEHQLKNERQDSAFIPDTYIQHKEEMIKNAASLLPEMELSGKQFIKDADEVPSGDGFEVNQAGVLVQGTLLHYADRKALISTFFEQWKSHVVADKQLKSQWQQFIVDARKTIDWMMKAEDDFFPKICGELGNTLEGAKQNQSRLDAFKPMIKKAQEDTERLLKTAELLVLQGLDTRGQRDQIINQLLKVHTRFQARIGEYRTLVNMSVKFFENLQQLDLLIATTKKKKVPTATLR